MERQQLTKTNQSSDKRGMHSAAMAILPTRAPVNLLLQLQRALGNQAMGRFIQAKLKIGQPNDIYEQEADRVAEQVMRMSENTAISGQPSVVRGEGESVQTKPITSGCPSCKEEELIQPKPFPVKIIHLVQRQPLLSCQASEVTPDIEARINILRGGGQPLPESIRTFFESRFDHDFSHVRVHTDVRAAESTRAVNAQAFTIGQDVVFGLGQYNPGIIAGKKLLAHELTHVIQQKDGFGHAIQRLPRYQDCDRQGGTRERDQIRNAHYRAIQILRNTNRILSDAIRQAQPLYYHPGTRAPRIQRPTINNRRLAPILNAAFEIRDFIQQLDRVRRVNRIVADSLAGLQDESTFNYECDYRSDWNYECAPSVYAWTGAAYDVHICWDFFSANPRNAALKIAHEATHKWGYTVHNGSDPIMDTGGYDWLFDRLNP